MNLVIAKVFTMRFGEFMRRHNSGPALRDAGLTAVVIKVHILTVLM